MRKVVLIGTKDDYKNVFDVRIDDKLFNVIHKSDLGISLIEDWSDGNYCHIYDSENRSYIEEICNLVEQKVQELGLEVGRSKR